MASFIAWALEAEVLLKIVGADRALVTFGIHSIRAIITKNL
ncbi:hypothetical protein [Bartonella phoceensis]|nr:hypothetical protein [Bartonella phoceensis]